jgi:hypothetical protein
MKMEQITINGFKINLPIGLPRGMETKVKDGYQDFLRGNVNDVKCHLHALTCIVPNYIRRLEHIPILRILHCFGGVGATAQVIDQVRPFNVLHEFWERDMVLLSYLNATYNDHHIVYGVADSFDKFLRMTGAQLDKYDVLLMDMSVGTIKTPYVKEMWEKISSWMRGNRFVWATDTACAKIHLNHKTYETDFHRPVANQAFSYMKAYDYWLFQRGMRIVEAMREAAEVYFVVQHSEKPCFSEISYIRPSEVGVK